MKNKVKFFLKNVTLLGFIPIISFAVYMGRETEVRQLENYKYFIVVEPGIYIEVKVYLHI